MLKCKQVSEQASEYVDGNVSGLHKVKFQMHLMMCTHCRSFIKKIKLTKDMVAKLSPMPASDDQLDKIMNAIEEDDKSTDKKE